jgi:predicted phosphoribosyltransferase
MRDYFRDREDAGARLATMLRTYAHQPDTVVLALPRGGVPVAAVIARELHAPLDVFLVRKIGVPGYEELAAGAIADGGVRVLNEDVIQAYSIPQYIIDEIVRREEREIVRQHNLYRANRPIPDIAAKIIILVDDGVATGSTVIAAARALRLAGPARIIVAVPVAGRDVAGLLRTEVETVVCAIETESLDGVSMWYEDFRQVSDEEVRRLLAMDFNRTSEGA